MRLVFKVIGIIFYVFSGLFFYLVNFSSFFDIPEGRTLGMKLVFVGTFAVLGGFFLFLGALTSLFKRCQLSIGVVFAGAASITIFTQICMFCIRYSPELFPNREMPEFSGMIGDPVLGIAVTVLFGCFGAWLIQRALWVRNVPQAAV